MRRFATICVLLACGCDSSKVTGVELTVRYDPSLALDQIAISGALEDGVEAFAPGLAPDPPRPLIDGEDSVVLLLPDDLAGRTVEMLVQGTASGAVVAEGRTEVAIARRSIVGATVELSAAPVKDAGVDGGVDEDGGPIDAEDTGAPDVLDAGIEDVPIEDVPVEDVPVEDVPIEDVPIEDVPVEDAEPVDTGEPDTGCVPAAEVIADGIDQDCDGFDACYQDLDGDDFGSAVVIADDDLDCTNASRPTATVSTDCDDDESGIRPGTACDDGSNGTANDLCFGPECRGYRIGGCGPVCSVCNGGCCNNGCGSSGNCPTCPDGCSCNYDCSGANNCDATCESNSVCHLFVNSAMTGSLRCEPGASCDLACNSTNTCTLDCADGAYCIISNCNSSSCTLECTGGAMSCPGGVEVCNRGCP